jgi:hypothetical protein
MAWVTEIKVDSSNVVVVHSVFNVFHVFMGLWQTDFHQLVSHLLLRVLELVHQSVISSVDLLTERKFSHFVVDHSQLLHFLMVLSDQVLFLLGKVSKISGWRTRIDLS